MINMDMTGSNRQELNCAVNKNQARDHRGPQQTSGKKPPGVIAEINIDENDRAEKKGGLIRKTC